jgi:thymidine kinase
MLAHYVGKKPKMGHLTLLMGCMFAQKTTELLRRIRRYKAIGYNVLVINYANDTRYGTNKIASHDIDTYDALCVLKIADVSAQVEGGTYQVVVIDEGQFYGDLYAHVTKWVDTLPIHIVVAGLSGDSNREPFGHMLRLIPHAEEIEHLTAFCGLCKDGTLARFSKCMKADKVEQVVIGSADIYMPVCRKHYLS